MRRCLVALLAGAACLGLGATGLAQSEPLRSAPVVAGLPADAILTIVRATGFEPSGRPVRRPGLYLVRALDPDDRSVDLTLDARTGRILAVRPAAGARPAPAYAAAPPRYGAFYPRRGIVFGLASGPFDDPTGFEDATGALPPPPRAIPSARAPMMAPMPKATRSAAVLPLPRPRPVASQPAPQSPPAPPAPPASPVPPALAAAAPATTMPPVTPLE